MKINKKYIIGFWILVSVSILSLYYFGPGIEGLKDTKDWVDENKTLSLFLYLLALSFRGLTFMPSTPLLFLGIALFNPYIVYFINIIGIITSSTLVYYFAQYLGIDEYFERNYPDKLKKIKKKLGNREFPVIAIWSLIFFVPTDLIVYAASSLRVKIWKVWAGVLVGESILNLFYIVTGSEVKEEIVE